MLLVHHLPSLEPGLPPADPSLGTEAAALARCRAFVATSPFTARLLASRGFPAERILTLTPAAPTPATEPAAPPRRYLPPLRALMVGNLIPRKAVLPLLEALAPRLADGRRLHPGDRRAHGQRSGVRRRLRGADRRRCPAARPRSAARPRRLTLT